MLSKKFSRLISAAAMVFSFAVFASAQTTTEAPKDGDKAGHMGHRGGRRGGEFGHRGGRGMGMGMLRGIELTDAQKEQIKSIHEANKPDQATLDQMKAIRETRKNGGTITDEQKAQMKQLRDAQRAKMESVHQQILAILTPEQKAQLEQRKADMQKRREEFRQKRQERIQAKPTDNN